VEHVVVQPKAKPLTEQVPQDEETVDQLINEDPVDMDGVEIIND
jgi:hypothetical protein